jgi:hypothetical protein
MKQIICVHVGQKYSDEYVYRLYESCKRYLDFDFKFTVLTDNRSYKIKDTNFSVVTVNDMNYLSLQNLWWYKMQAFRPDVATEDQNLLLDLDIVLTDNISKLFDFNPDKFVIIQDFNRQFNANYQRSNSSVVKFTHAIASEIWEKWSKDPVYFVRKYRGDQDWFDDEYQSKIRWPNSWIKSWKWEVYLGGLKNAGGGKYYSDKTFLPKDCAILVFHGKPNPHEVEDKLVKDYWDAFSLDLI